MEKHGANCLNSNSWNLMNDQKMKLVSILLIPQIP